MSKPIERYMSNNRVVKITNSNSKSTTSIGKANPVIEVVASAVASGTGIGGTVDPNSHTHPNKYLLDGLSIDSEERMHYYSSLVSIPLIQEDW